MSAITLSPGAVEFPLHHLSIRVAWNDLDWTGRLCAAPEVHTIRARCCRASRTTRTPPWRRALLARAWQELEGHVDLPPCVTERGGFMRGQTFRYERIIRTSNESRSRTPTLAPPSSTCRSTASKQSPSAGCLGTPTSGAPAPTFSPFRSRGVVRTFSPVHPHRAVRSHEGWVAMGV